MIEYIRGSIAELSPTYAVLDANGVGYGLNITLNTYTAMQGLQGDVKLYVFESIREDAYVLWGFATKVERELFLLLTSVSGVGGQSARVILSGMTPAELCDAISRSDERLLKSAKGIGGKTAQRIIVELKDKIVTLGIDAAAGSTLTESSGAVMPNKEVLDEAVAALTMLGFSPAPSQKAALGILRAEPDATVERVIKLALKML
ncbi:MAG: Holliday junction branch migration protein RuvA [Bacteroidaceae bacterium]|nr:Holliday junction branch migration protein RuvA [Bacteroidaceae bacterium]